MTSWQKQAAADLRNQLTAMGHRQLPSNRDGFDDEFDALRAVDHKIRCNRDEFYTAQLGSNMSKNRFREILPNEGTRVVLDPINSRGDGDYINANYVDGRRLFGVPFVYIAAQAPLPGTVADFWRMVYENNTAFIVMLCAEIEAGKVKSERYWPDTVGEVMPVGSMNVVLVNENHRNDTIFRTIALRTIEGRERTIHHLQYIRWPDQGIPHNSAGLIEIIYTLGRTPLSTQTPIVVHCSGGAGRTGVFLALHVALSLFQLEQTISMPRIVQYLKYCRCGLIQRKDQYLFSYYATLREMEKMIWAAETAKHGNSRNLPAPTGGNNYRDITRRNIEYVPRHAAQSAPDFGPKSALGHTDEQQYLGANRSLNHSAVRSRDLAAEHSIHAAADISTLPQQSDDVDDALTRLRRQNQRLRSTPSRLHPNDHRSTSGGLEPLVGDRTNSSIVNRSAHLPPMGGSPPPQMYYGGSGSGASPVHAVTTTSNTYTSQVRGSSPLRDSYSKPAPDLVSSPQQQPPRQQSSMYSSSPPQRPLDNQARGNLTDRLLGNDVSPINHDRHMSESPPRSSHTYTQNAVSDAPKTAGLDWTSYQNYDRRPESPQQRDQQAQRDREQREQREREHREREREQFLRDQRAREDAERARSYQSVSPPQPTQQAPPPHAQSSQNREAASGSRPLPQSDLTGAADAFHSDVFGQQYESQAMSRGESTIGFSSNNRAGTRKTDFGLL